MVDELPPHCSDRSAARCALVKDRGIPYFFGAKVTAKVQYVAHREHKRCNLPSATVATRHLGTVQYTTKPYENYSVYSNLRKPEAYLQYSNLVLWLAQKSKLMYSI